MPKRASRLSKQEAFVGSRQRSALLYADGKIYVRPKMVDGRSWHRPKTDSRSSAKDGFATRALPVPRSSPTADCISPAPLRCTASATEGSTQNASRHRRVDGRGDARFGESGSRPGPDRPGRSIAATWPRDSSCRSHVFNALGQTLDDPDARCSIEVEGPGTVERVDLHRLCRCRTHRRDHHRDGRRRHRYGTGPNRPAAAVEVHVRWIERPAACPGSVPDTGT